jgi:hypothetical protein
MGAFRRASVSRQDDGNGQPLVADAVSASQISARFRANHSMPPRVLFLAQREDGLADLGGQPGPRGDHAG